MGVEKTKEFLGCRYEDPIPEGWRKMLCARKDLLSEDSVLYRKFWYGGLRDREEMERLIFTLFYLRYHVDRLP